MLVEKISNKQIVFSFSLELNGLVLQRLIDYAKYLEATAELKAREYAKYLEATAGSTAKQEDIDALRMK
jgi:hypothetical protein